MFGASMESFCPHTASRGAPPSGDAPKCRLGVYPNPSSTVFPTRRFPAAQNHGGHVVGDDATIVVIRAPGSLALGAGGLELAARTTVLSGRRRRRITSAGSHEGLTIERRTGDPAPLPSSRPAPRCMPRS